MASTSTGYAAAPNYSIPYQQNTNYDEVSFIGPEKLGLVNDIPNTVGAVALRYKVLSFNLNVNTQVAIAHGAVDANGNPAVPVFTEIVYSSSGSFYRSQAPDSTNIYLTAPAGATTAVTGQIGVFW